LVHVHGQALVARGPKGLPKADPGTLVGAESFGVMGIEALNNAARAAGFAMAAPDDTPEEEVARKPALEKSWRPAQPVRLLAPPVQVARPSQLADWFRSMLGVTGRGAPAGAR
jgi:hypothetical protein